MELWRTELEKETLTDPPIPCNDFTRGSCNKMLWHGGLQEHRKLPLVSTVYTGSGSSGFRTEDIPSPTWKWKGLHLTFYMLGRCSATEFPFGQPCSFCGYSIPLFPTPCQLTFHAPCPYWAVFGLSSCSQCLLIPFSGTHKQGEGCCSKVPLAGFP